MKMIRVQDKRGWKLFHAVLKNVYRSDPNYIYPLRGQIQETFDPAVNQPAAEGKFACYVLLDETQNPVGRIAAFVDPAQNKNPEQPRLGGIGFFECVSQQAYAFALFDQAVAFLQEQDMQVMEGPINFGERDRYWGLLVKGFDPPLYQENYHPPYYRNFFAGYGFQPFEQILTFHGRSRAIPFTRLRAIAERLKSRQPIEVKPLDLKRIDEFAEGFASVYNAAFGPYDHFKPITPGQIKQFIEQAKLIVDPQLVCIAYYDGVPAGFIALYPDINPALKGSKGKLNWWTLPRFLLRNSLQRQKNAKGMGFGIHPDYQSKGIFAFLVDYLCSPRNLEKYPEMYLAQIRTHNHNIRSMYAKLGVQVDRIHVTYRKALDPSIAITPFEFIDY